EVSHPGTVTTNPFTLTGNGVLNYAGSMFGVQASEPNGMMVTNFTGTASLVGLSQRSLCPGDGPCRTWGNFSITGSGAGANVLGLGLVGPSTTFWNDTSGD